MCDDFPVATKMSRKNKTTARLLCGSEMWCNTDNVQWKMDTESDVWVKGRKLTQEWN